MNIGLKERYMKENKKGRIIALVANTTWNIYNFRLNLIEKFENNRSAKTLRGI